MKKTYYLVDEYGRELDRSTHLKRIKEGHTQNPGSTITIIKPKKEEKKL